jgi:hypothetical protein
MASVSTQLGTRSQTAIWLVGQTEPSLPQDVLPTTAQVLQTFFHHHKTLRRTVAESLKSTTEELMVNWGKAHISVALYPNIISKMRAVVDEYNLLKKNKRRTSEAQSGREAAFTAQMKLLFDISLKKAESKIKIEEDKAFLEDQRGVRKMRMSGVDKELAEKHERAGERRKIEKERKLREIMRVRAAEAASSEHENNEDSAEAEESRDDDYKIEIPLYYKKQVANTGACTEEYQQAESADSLSQTKKPRILEASLNSPEVAATLDRINLSDRKFTMLAAAIAKANGVDLDRNSLSRSTVRRKRLASRSVIDTTIREEFHNTEKPPLVLHSDGKIMQDSTNMQVSKAKVDRVAVAVTGHSVEKILGIAKIKTGTGKEQANAMMQLLSLWELANDIVGMSFDTTATNTGAKNGACILLQNQLHKNLLNLACRHHVHEVIIGGVFTCLFGPSRSPNIALFERFQQYWPNVDIQNFQPLDDPRLEEPSMQQLRIEVVSFLQSFLTTEGAYIPREDYREMIQLCLLVLGVPLGHEYHFRLPGAYHMARWMAKVIYCFKIFLFRKEFKLTTKEMKSLGEFCLFASHIYVKAWISCPVTCDAPVNDLQLFKQLKQYAVVNKGVSEAALKKLENHLWYVGPELVPLSLFSDKISTEEKRLIVQRIQQCGDNWTIRGIKLESTDGLETKSLHHLVASSSQSALRSLGLDIDFLFNSDPITWNQSPAFQKVKSIIASLKVVNDMAERSIALMSSCNLSITKSETEMQKLIQVVEDHRKRVPDARKSILKAYTPR